MMLAPQELNSICRYNTAIYMQQVEQEEKRYVIVSATHGHKGKKLHWVIAEKRKRDDYFRKGKPVGSLCGLHASRIADSSSDLPQAKITTVQDEYGHARIKEIESNDFFFQYTEDELFQDLKLELQMGARKVKKRYRVDNVTGKPIEDIMSIPYEDLKENRVRVVEEYRTPKDIKQEGLWCKQCQKKKADLYPDL
jgi:hypothetical protein